MEFRIKKDGYIRDNYAWYGNMFLTGNGYMGIRGTLDEYKKDMMCAINLSGIYDKAEGQTWRESVNAPNGAFIELSVDGKRLALPEVEPLHHTQELDFYNAIQLRSTTWETERGTVSVKSERFASMYNKHLICIRYTVTADHDCSLSAVSGIDADVWDINGRHFVKYGFTIDSGALVCIAVTGEKKTTIAVKEFSRSDLNSTAISKSELGIYKIFSSAVRPGKEYVIEKFIHVSTSGDERPSDTAITGLDYNSQKALHIREWKKIWDLAFIKIDGDEEAQLALNYSIYHLNCIAPRHSSSCSIPARGLSGQVYKGAVFWDTEMFMLDHYLHTAPDVAKTLLRYRIDTLDGAKKKAAQYGFDGAFYAWESQEGGFDACTDYNVVDVFTQRPMRTFFRDKQMHISAAIVYAIKKYIKYTNDISLLKEGGLEVVTECALFYRSLLLKYANKDIYEIHDVIGPDEYHERVNNNAYTNRMAKFVFDFTAEACEICGSAEYNELTDELKALSAKLYIPAPRSSDNVIEQFDGYFELEDCSIDEVRSRLLDPKEYWGGAYGVASHTQIIKQADVAAMLSMFKDDYPLDILKANMDYYEPRTEHGSSLSACMYALLSCYTGDADRAYPFFIKSASADLKKGGKEWAGLVYIGGTHPASSGGAWMTAVYGFAGLETNGEKISCTPHLPSEWRGMHFKIRYNGRIYRIDISRESCSIKPEKLKAVIFDLDGVLVSTDAMHFEAWKKLGREIGIDNFTEADNRRQRGVSRMASLEVLLEKTDKKYSENEKETLAERKNKYYKELLKALTRAAVLDGAFDMIDLLKKNGIMTAVGSVSKNTPVILERTGLAPHIDKVACGLDITRSKPDPEVFLKAAEKLGVYPESCVVIEDSDAGITAAKAAGMTAVAIGAAKNNVDADYRANTLADVDISAILGID